MTSLRKYIVFSSLFVTPAGFLLKFYAGPGHYWFNNYGAGILYEIFFIGKFKILPLIFYVGMGWIVIVAMKPLIASVPKGFIWLLLAGGLCYTIGVIFYALKVMKFHHMIWHFFVLGGSTCHFVGMLLYMTGLPINS